MKMLERRRSSQRKGKCAEREIVRLLRDAGIPSRRVPLSGSIEGSPGDVVIELGGRELVGEVKRRKEGFMDLPDLEAALEWVDRNQLGRRNLTDEERAVVIGRLYERRKRQGRRTDLTSGQIDQRLTTAEQIARELKIGEKTVRRAAEFLRAVEVIRQADPQAAERILRGELKDALTNLPRVYREDKKVIERVADQIARGKVSRVEDALRNARIKIKPWDRMRAILPSLSEWEMRLLRESIEAFGVQYPILILPDGRIIDGYHRWLIAGDECPYEVLNISEDEAFELGVVLNLERRQLSFEQIQEIYERLSERLNRDGESQKKLAAGVEEAGDREGEGGSKTKRGGQIWSSGWEREGEGRRNP